MASRTADPIVAPATPVGPAERCVLRLSGAGLADDGGGLLPPDWPRPRGRREAVAGRIEWAPGCRVEAALLVFPGPGSATGEDVLELHLPGCAPVVDAVLARLYAAGARPAEPGEFTRRAFRAGRIDLVQAEAVLDLVSARTAAGARAAAALLAGRPGDRVREAREVLAAALAQLEAGLDFEEGDAQDLRPDEIEPLLAAAADALAAGLAHEDRRRLRRGPPRILLLGRPNAGKTTLFRRLTGVEALVSDRAGTTRDRLEALWRPDDVEEGWILIDGPGRGGAAADPRDAAARARAEAEDGAPADLVWLVADASDPAGRPPEPPAGAPALVVWTKNDLPRRVPEAAVAARGEPAVWIAAERGEGLTELARLSRRLLDEVEELRLARAGASERHRQALRAAAEAVDRARGLRAAGLPADLAAEELRAALLALAELAGELTPEDLLDRIFARFCIGK
ncbi:MAG: tRNA uridine-5-carboxymethylaminomethyl(34) synthesis GTPase MnmE [Planctomycetota bacterium]|nr:MAG: tRNA uridine-5-carboxymethylaminomethyl(34) synthesis GTPase MnmE [Planctomycetota bacterium]